MNEDIFIQEIIEEYHRRIGKKTLYLLGDLEYQQLNQLKLRYRIVKQININVDLMLITKLSTSSLIRLAHLYGKTKEETEILEMLHQKRKVYMLKSGMEYLRYKQTTYRLLYRQYQEYEQKLQYFGVDLINSCNEIVGKKGGDFG